MAPASISAPPHPVRLLDLFDEAAAEPACVGAKAAALARASAAGLPVLPGFVISTGDGEVDPEELRAAWDRLSDGGARRLVVRSSSTAEDGAESSMAGRFRSVIGVQGWEAFQAAVAEVAASAHGPRVLTQRAAEMAVLVQPELDAIFGGVMFGLDPVTARSDVVVAVIEGGPERLVSGLVEGVRYSLGRGGRILSRSGDPDIELSWTTRRSLVRLSRAAARCFGGPQDVEWGTDRSGTLWMFQSRPITVTGRAERARGPVYGAGPLAETFPHPLCPLEEDLWFAPLRGAVLEAFVITGAAGRRTLAKRPVVTTVGGRAAADLVMFGYREPARTFFARIDPRGPLRRLRRSWAVGRLRVALPAIAMDVIARTDEELGQIPPVATLSDDRLLNILGNSRQMLVSLHGHEVLVGALSPADDAATSAGAIALRALAEGRKQNLNDQELIARLPWVLALAPPSLQAPELPDKGDVLRAPASDGDERPSLRENLRMRVRWTQELTARVCRELGSRLVSRGILDRVENLGLLSVEELARAARTGERIEPVERWSHDGPPLPAAFRLSDTGAVVAELDDRVTSVGAGGGRVSGTVRRPADDPDLGDILIVTTLDPDLAPLLVELKGLIAETGSPLSHLAILARELGVTTVVGAAAVARSLTTGDRVVIDGTTGEIEPIDARVEVSA